MYEHVCRLDDLLSHTTGEMTNPSRLDHHRARARRRARARVRRGPRPACVGRRARGRRLRARGDPAARSGGGATVGVLDSLGASEPTRADAGRRPSRLRAERWSSSAQARCPISANATIVRGDVEERFANKRFTCGRRRSLLAGGGAPGERDGAGGAAADAAARADDAAAADEGADDACGTRC